MPRKKATTGMEAIAQLNGNWSSDYNEGIVQVRDKGKKVSRATFLKRTDSVSRKLCERHMTKCSNGFKVGKANYRTGQIAGRESLVMSHGSHAWMFAVPLQNMPKLQIIPMTKAPTDHAVGPVSIQKAATP
jgi:hypothetical protein